MSAIYAYRHSLAYRWVRASMLGTFCANAAQDHRKTLERASIVGGSATLPGAFGILSLIGVLGFGCSLLYGNSALAAMFALFLTALYYPVPGLALTPALLIWAPRLPVMVLGDELLFLRLDQAVIAGMVAACVLGRRATLRTPPANTALLLFLLTIPLSIIAGIVQGTLATPLSSVLYLAQWLTWYGLFVAAYSLGHRLGPLAVYAWTLPLIALAAYGLAEQVWPFLEAPEVRYRTFERGLFPGQANHAGGLLALATVTGLALAAGARHRALGIALAVFSTLALFPTGSRTSLLAWGGGMVALALFYLPALRWWMPPLALVGLFAIPNGIWYRFSAPGSSMYDRLIAWKSALSTLPDYPLLGLGAGARHRSFYDNQYLMTLAESGIVGLVLLLLFLAVLARALYQKYAGRAARSRATRVRAPGVVTQSHVRSIAPGARCVGQGCPTSLYVRRAARSRGTRVRAPGVVPQSHVRSIAPGARCVGQGCPTSLYVGRAARSRATTEFLPDPDTRWMTAGAFLGVVVLAIHGLATATFIVTLVAGPFFWLCGVALSDGEASS